MAENIREQHISAVVIDTEADFIRLDLAAPIAEAMEAPCIRLEDLHAEALVDAVRLHTDRGLSSPKPD